MARASSTHRSRRVEVARRVAAPRPVGRDKKTAVRIYWAAPLFTAAERMFNTACAAALRRLGFSVYLPQDDTSSAKPSDTYHTYHCDVLALEGSDVVVACLDGPDPDSGTGWKVGYARGKGKPVVVFRTDDRLAELPGHGRCNLMLLQSANMMFFVESRTDVVLLARYLRDAVASVVESARRLPSCT